MKQKKSTALVLASFVVPLLSACAVQNSLVTEIGFKLSVEHAVINQAETHGPLVLGVSAVGSGDDRALLGPAVSYIPSDDVVFVPTGYACFQDETLRVATWTRTESGGTDLSSWEEASTDVSGGGGGIRTATFGLDQDPQCETFTALAEAWLLPPGLSCDDPDLLDTPFDSETHSLLARAEERTLGDDSRVCYLQAETDDPPTPPVVSLQLRGSDITAE